MALQVRMRFADLRERAADLVSNALRRRSAGSRARRARPPSP
jgi:hypothetical protein